MKGSAIPARAPDHASLAAPIGAELEARLSNPEASGKPIWLLEHDYSLAGLSFATPKYTDASVARLLTDAADRAGFALHAATLQVEETAAAEYEGWDREVEDVGDDEYEYVEPIETSCRLDGCVRPDGEAAPRGALPLLEGVTMPAGRLDPGRPDSQRPTEASGNEGAMLERIYRRAALVMWRNDGGPRVLAEADAGSLQRSGSVPEPPMDWRLPTERLTCGCEHCAELRNFCADPVAEVHRFAVRAELRAHIGTEIALAGIDIRRETERHGWPYTLVCIKTHATWERQLEQYREDIAGMRRLAAAAGAVPGSDATARALGTAITASQGLPR